MVRYEQGDIIKIEGMDGLFLIASNSTFNKNEVAMVCPISKGPSDHPLHPYIYDNEENHYTVLCEHVMFRDLSVRGYTVINHIPYGDLINVADTIQGLFDY